MLKAILRFFLGWIPFLGQYFQSRPKPKKFDDLPRARVAVIGAGIGGCFAAKFLREQGGENLDIHVWAKKGSKVGGRTATFEFAGHQYETGGSIIHSGNKYMVDAAKEFGLETKGELDPTIPLGIFDGKSFIFRTGTSKIFTMVTTLWHYGISVIKQISTVGSLVKKFCTIYDIQISGQSFATVADMLKAMGGNDMYALTQVSTKEELVKIKGWSEKMVDELITGAIRMNYGQDTAVNSLVTFVALAGMQDGYLWSVVGGNWQIPQKLLEESNATFHEEDVTAITKVEKDGKITYTVTSPSTETGDTPGEFDVVIVANPINVSNVKYENFSTPVYTAASTTPYQRTVAEFVKGRLNTAAFGKAKVDRDYPLVILTTDIKANGAPINFRSVAIEVPSEIPQDEVKNYSKPLKEDPVRVWKVFMPEPFTQEQRESLFSDIEDYATVDWLAYPHYEPPEKIPPFIFDDGVFYINAIEKAASAMEMSAIGAKNCSLLAYEYIKKSQ